MNALMKILYTITLIFLLQLQVFADIPFIQTSDSHSAYDKVERLILYSHYLHQKYKTKLNLDNMYLIHSGDLSGASEWTDFDKGKILYDVKMSYYSQLALTMGNHDGMDYDSSDVAEADRYFTQETKEFIKKNKTALLGANIRIKDSKYKNFFQPSVDFLLDEVKKTKVRVVGLVFAEFTGFINSGMPGVADETVAMFEEAKKQIEMAAKDTSIKRVIFSCHERYAPVEELSKEIFEWKKLHPEYSHIKTDLYFSAHDHERVFKRLESGYIINSGYQMEAMTFFVLDSEGNFSHKPEQVIFNEVDEVKLQQIKLSWRNKLPVQTIKELDELELLMKKVILDNKIILEKNVPIIPYTRSDLKAGRHILGMALSDSYVK